MEELSPAVAVTLSLSTSICDNPAISNNMEITRLKLVTDTASLLSDHPSLLHVEPNTSWDGNSNSMKAEVGRVPFCGPLQTVLGAENGPIVSDSIIQGNEEDGILSIGEDPYVINGEELLPLGASSELSLPIAVEIEGIDNGQILAKVISLEERSLGRKISNLSAVAAIPDDEITTGPMLKASVVALPLPSENEPVKESVKSVFELECVPLWGSVSICGKRPEMEDALMVVPNFIKIPIKMFIGDRVIDGLSQRLSHLTSHFYGVYDGHGGSQVADYCCKRIHLALVEELKHFKDDMVDGSAKDTRQVQWEKVFTSCFLKVDDEVGGKVNSDPGEDNIDTTSCASEPIAPETVGSTAVVAVICSSHIVVSNCGDSRAVLYRGKEAMALSIDHKPSREDEYARIEASGGKVIQWNGHRVFGVLAMSRSIGDRYLKPWIIPEPEVMFVPRAREDECLVLASDGLWDVMSNEEACEVARRRILLWHKKNGTNPLPERGQGVDPAAQAAAEYLSTMALQKGSKDNISVIVVDLKAQRKFKSKC
ncbi:PREDICTED: protein phosphatase 2C 16-like isoform X1 [Nicotiana attenuata]|uniref:protein-serine/threonine phosphatase n=2 Tax=Nicotiana attenuata TaxID=49451 RepID=A0A314L0X1_NICAT|nr:PREDICTED: protein phosphatase 2C 16-like isoform X1 [Nicotiana attenuata]XP_019266059.1 PREDICTED: protein phosphatase 2C 16-like isoform X1 [Nicotiana attenuata]XP_019266060.1 PREDICTED: protein phosphatase 2C 16-like isoform X1 [Nicotiana attenuata]XP_019266061.1 PREDICTED: protein phosphatase 2C 16-like isoform X1 [Nicotiana attenuata]XP_019266062.1 PREDICTED: protein phosphatase 2C 16-like isoform X1 [Nicotiana attenuata]OIT35276.1 protein phosphatase 2c 16 [Nicotiana attenuata]